MEEGTPPGLCGARTEEAVSSRAGRDQCLPGSSEEAGGSHPSGARSSSSGSARASGKVAGSRPFHGALLAVTGVFEASSNCMLTELVGR